MPQAERMEKILAVMERDGFVTVSKLVEELHYSPASIRRDLTELDHLALIRKDWGGAMLREDNLHALTAYPFRLQKNSRKKQRIAAVAEKLIRDGDVIFVDGSSTASFLEPFLYNKKEIHVVTNNAELASHLGQNHVHVTCTGGESRGGVALLGAVAEGTVERIHADVCFFSAHSLAPDGTVTDVGEAGLRLVEKMMKNSEKSVFLCDSDKVAGYSTYSAFTLGAVDTVISDADIRDKLEHEYPDTAFLWPEGGYTPEGERL